MTIKEALNILQFEGTNNLPKENLLEQIKKAYRTVSKKFHPDLNPAGEKMMKLINSAYEYAMKQIDYVAGADYEANTTSYSDELSLALNKIIRFSGINIEVCGNWVWVSGNTKQYREALKEANFKYAPKKKMWYYKPSTYVKRRKTAWDINHIRSTFGSEEVETEKNKNKVIG